LIFSVRRPTIALYRRSFKAADQIKRRGGVLTEKIIVAPSFQEIS
jgi:hypothetical protein